MRAIFESQKKLEIGAVLHVVDERVHHLNVVRAKLADEILILDGNGSAARSSIKLISKKEVHLEIFDISVQAQKMERALFLAVPKKDAFEDILKIAVECGFTDLFPLTTKYSQYIFEESDRINKIVESAMVQSNNFFKPKIHNQISLSEFLSKTEINFGKTFLFTSFGSTPLPNKNDFINLAKWGIFIGPEAGFTEDEEREILTSPQRPVPVHLPVPIMRAPTAVAVSVGYVLGIR